MGVGDGAIGGRWFVKRKSKLSEILQVLARASNAKVRSARKEEKAAVVELVTTGDEGILTGKVTRSNSAAELSKIRRRGETTCGGGWNRGLKQATELRRYVGCVMGLMPRRMAWDQAGRIITEERRSHLEGKQVAYRQGGGRTCRIESQRGRTTKSANNQRRRK